VTLLLFQLFAFGCGEAETVTVKEATTVNAAELLADPPTVTTIGSDPITTPLGTVVEIWVLLHELATAETPPNVTVLVLCVVPNPVPVIVTAFPAG